MMAAADNINFSQFEKHTAPNGKEYEIGKELPWDHHVLARPVGAKRPVGSLSYFSKGGLSAGTDPERPEVYKAFVKPAHRRRGIASAMFDYAERNGAAGLQHSGALSDEGKSFKSGHTLKQGYSDAT